MNVNFFANERVEMGEVALAMKINACTLSNFEAIAIILQIFIVISFPTLIS